jgi:hypothetical protein
MSRARRCRWHARAKLLNAKLSNWHCCDIEDALAMQRRIWGFLA